MKPSSLLKLVDRFPPNFCRLLARKNRGQTPMSHRDIAWHSGLSVSYISTLSAKTTWKGIPVDVIDRFSRACGVDILNPRTTMEYLRRRKRTHLRQLNAQQRKFIAKILKRGSEPVAPKL